MSRQARLPWRVPVPRGPQARPTCRNCGARLRALVLLDWPHGQGAPSSRYFAGWGYDGRGWFHSGGCAQGYARAVLEVPAVALVAAITVLKRSIPGGAWIVEGDQARRDVQAVRAMMRVLDAIQTDQVRKG